MLPTKDYKGYVLFIFENGKIAKVPLESYATKTNRKKLANAYSDKDRLAAVLFTENDGEDIVILSSSGRALVINTGELSPKTTRNTQGVQVMKLKKGHRVISAKLLSDEVVRDPERYRAKTIPSMGQLPRSNDEQLMLDFDNK